MIAMLPRPLIAVCVCVLSVTSGSRCLIAAPPSVEIASIVDLFNDDAPLDASQVPYTRKESTVIASRFFTDRKMRRVGIRMTSQTYRGRKCLHDVTVYLPDRELPEESVGAAAIILGGAGIRAAHTNPREAPGSPRGAGAARRHSRSGSPSSRFTLLIPPSMSRTRPVT